MSAPRLVSLSLLLTLLLPAAAAAQRDEFLGAFVQFYRALRGAYGDEGPQLVAALETMTSTLAAWDREIGAAEAQLRARLGGADVPTALQVHALLASRYLDRGRFDEALREFESAIRLDPTRAAFHRYRGLILQAAGRTDEAADAFRAEWRLEPSDPQNAYRLLVHRSDETTPAEVEQALSTLARVEGEVIRRERPSARAPFRTTQTIDDDAGGAMGFVPPAYTRGVWLLQRGAHAEGLTALRAAVAADPLVVDPALRSAPLMQGIAALRQGQVDAAIERLEAGVTRAGESAQAHRVLATAYGVRGDIASSVRHLREAVRLNPRDERAWLALTRTLEETGETAEAMASWRAALDALPDSVALRWRLVSARRPRIDDVTLDLIAAADELVLFAGKGELLGQLAGLALTDLDGERAVHLLEQRVALTPNNAAAHQALGLAYVERGREDLAVAELVMALLLDPFDAGTLTALGQRHLAAGRLDQAIAALERALALEAGDSEALHALGSALIRAGRTAEGRERLEESARRQADDVEDQRSRRTAAMLAVQAEIARAKGDYDAAIDLYQQAVTTRRYSVGHLPIAGALIAAGRLDEAASVLEAAIPQDPSPETFRRLADVYAQLGRVEESERARQAYTAQRLQELRGG